MKALVLGGAGYLGSRIVRILAQSGWEICCVIHKHKIKDLREEYSRITFVSDDTNEIDAVMKRTEFDWILNFAASYSKGDTLPRNVIKTNVIFAVEVLNLAVENGVKNYLAIDTALPDNFNLYSFSKKRFAEFGRFYASEYDMNFYDIVLEMFYGPGEPEDRFFPSCISSMKKGEVIRLTEGRQKRDIIHVEDVCQAIQCVIGSNRKGYQKINVGTGDAPTIREVVEYMHHILESDSKLMFGTVPMRKNEPSTCADISILKELGFKVRYPWREGLRELCDIEKGR